MNPLPIFQRHGASRRAYALIVITFIIVVALGGGANRELAGRGR
jgi:hypothetical protein